MDKPRSRMIQHSPVRHGFWFDIHAYRLEDPWDDEVAQIQLGLGIIKRQIADFAEPHFFTA